jgi:hypothetical protein
MYAEVRDGNVEDVNDVTIAVLGVLTVAWLLFSSVWLTMLVGYAVAIW